MTPAFTKLLLAAKEVSENASEKFKGRNGRPVYLSGQSGEAVYCVHVDLCQKLEKAILEAEEEPVSEESINLAIEISKFDEWYVDSTFDLGAEPIGGRTYALQKRAWLTSAKFHQEQPVEYKNND